MAEVHPNPGYFDYESSLRKAFNNPNLLDSTHYRDSSSLERSGLDHLLGVKNWAKEVWSRPDSSETTYQFDYNSKQVLERTKSAPTEAQRRNNPHPKQVFLTNRLHYVPGYHNADSTLGKSSYKIDAVCESPEQSYRNDIRSKYISELSKSALRQYESSSADNDYTKWNRTLPPNDLWMSSGNKRAGNNTIESIDDALRQSVQNQTNEIASHSRYLRLAGAEERSKIQRLLDAKPDSDKIPNMMIPYQVKGTVGSQKQKDKANVQANPHKPLYRFPRPRGDFLIHPVWPPSMWHHRIPGFQADPPSRGVMSAYERHQRTRLDGIY